MSDNKVIWITGASSGIGRALAIKFVNNGWTVAISARRNNLLEEMCKKYPGMHSFPLDVTDAKKCKEVFQEILDKLKNIEICFFCTGIHDPESEKKLNIDNLRKIMEVNFFGTINSINATVDYFKDKKSGQISMVSSVAGYRGLPAAGAYCASKSALSSFAESFYFDMKRFNVKISLVNPGFIKTPMTDKNKFKMPFIKSAEFAAEQIYAGLVQNKNFEIHFPKSLTYIMKVLKILPNFLYFKIINIANKFMK